MGNFYSNLKCQIRYSKEEVINFNLREKENYNDIKKFIKIYIAFMNMIKDHANGNK